MFALTGLALGGAVRLPIDVCAAIHLFCQPRTWMRCKICDVALVLVAHTRPLIKNVPATLTVCGNTLLSADLVLERTDSRKRGLAVDVDRRGVAHVTPTTTPELVSVQGALFENSAARLLQCEPYKCLCDTTSGEQCIYVCLACFLMLRHRRRVLLRWRERAHNIQVVS
jgi:hypothetical protein